MAGIWLYVHTTPPAQIYGAPELLAQLNPSLPRHAAAFAVGDTRAQIGQQNEAFVVTIDADTTLRKRIVSQMPGLRVDVYDGGTLSRSGIASNIDSISTDGVTLDCEGADWTRSLLFRSSAQLGQFADVSPLPWRFGRNVRGACISMTPTRTVWLWADHASGGIREVLVDGQRYGAWEWRNDTDGNGNPITVLITRDPIDEGAELVAIGDGTLDARTGGVLENPADVALELCRRAGRDVDRGALVPFRRECQERGIVIAGSLEGGTLQAALVSIADSIGAVFARTLPGLMRLVPINTATLTVPASRVASGRQSEEVITRVRAAYAVDVDGKARASVGFLAPAHTA
jgi:hypothetical protein